MTEALAVKTGAIYTVTDITFGETREETFVISASSFDWVYLRRFLSICEISFRTPVSDLQPGICGTMTHGGRACRVRVTAVSPSPSLSHEHEHEHETMHAQALALVASRSERLDYRPSPEPSQVIPEIEAQFYDL